jgi:hypothetical protein
MQEIIQIAKAILKDIIIFATDFWLLFAVLGGLVLVLIISKLFRRRRVRHDGDDGDIEFLEVDPEPVIVYRRAAEQQNEPSPAPEPDSTTEPDPEPLSEPDIDPISEPEPLPDPEPLPVPKIDPQLLPDPEPQPDSEAKPFKAPSQKLPPALAEPMPYLESELANDALKLFDEQGFRLETVLYQGKFGADFIAVRPGIRAYVQIKDWKKKSTDITIQDVYNYANSNDCNQVVLLSLTGSDRSATKTAKKLGVILWTPKDLKKLRKSSMILHEEAAPAND